MGYRVIKQSEKDRQDPESLAALTKKTDMQHWTESLENHLRQVYSIQGTSLAYVIRDDPIMSTWHTDIWTR